MSMRTTTIVPPAGELTPADYEAALSGAFAMMASRPEPGTPESAMVERIFGLDPCEAVKTARFMAVMKEAARRWADAQ